MSDEMHFLGTDNRVICVMFLLGFKNETSA